MLNHKIVLLTGAGFTHNFGAPLSAEVWTHIFNNREIQYSPHLRKELLGAGGFDFEDVYYRVNNSASFSDNEKTILIEAVSDAYLNIDNIVRNPVHKAAIPKVERHLIGLFKNSYMFTLNQDLFVERHFHRYPTTNFELPGAGSKLLSGVGGEFNKKEHITIIERHGVDNWRSFENKKQNILYVKLHGSFDWRDSDNESLMVIGREKEQSIKRHHLLKSYLDKFTEILNIGKTKILIIGYGFNDSHINRVLAEAKDLEIYVVDPTSPKIWFNSMRRKEKYGQGIVAKVSGYYPVTLKDLFPDDNFLGNKDSQWLGIKSAFGITSL